MEVKATVADIARFEAGAIMVGVYEGQERPEGAASRVDEAMGGAISQLLGAGEI